ncbi:MAG: hypothetical protein ACREP9_08560 [Candidatus Dormibacteraceae bacterium]
MVSFPLSPVDAKINSLGARSNIHSARDAEAYIDALLQKHRFDDPKLPGLSEVKARVARAEYSAVEDPSREIPEHVIAEAFNRMMDEWSAPPWTRISEKELHAFRALKALVLYPAVVSRSHGGDLSPTSRPVEALYVLYLLQAGGGVPAELREKVKEGGWPDLLSSRQATIQSQKLQLITPNPEKARRQREYFAARDAHFQSHPILDPVEEVNRLLNALRIE